MTNIINGEIIHSRYRPKMVITYYKKPAPGQNTCVKGWGEKGQWDVKEDMLITTRLKTKQELQSHVIIDILQAKVTRNRFDDASNEEIYKHFMEKYSSEVQRALEVWMRQNFSTEAVRAEIEKLKAEAEAKESAE